MKKIRIPSRIASALVGASLLVLASCGGDDGGSGLVPSESVATDMGPTDSISEEDMALAGAMLGLSDKCTAIYTSMMDAFATLGSTDVSAKDTFDALVSEFNDIRDMVPGDLRGDIDVLAAAYGRYGELLAQAEDDPNIFADPDFMAEFENIMMTDEFNAANERFTAWISTECAVGS